ncbi:PadR family transcriptional regulator [Candidatus Stoquefichus sp. SB1]|uniref:PadR family transcriptional regulator n=1 Tax=Candidatus Stoquefichus sp. SB1 TaxID=1658109 RepID=UPI00067EFE2B|nr:helix-turn-helix transcriptional regulator [Candidatus Stoquefichus sp. SB1]
MPRVQLKTLTEQMYYVLLALKKERYGVEISQYIEQLTHGRVVLGPGTLYAILSKFEDEKWIQEKKSEGRKRSYIITNIGRIMLEKEYQHLLEMIEDTKQSEDDIYET